MRQGVPSRQPVRYLAGCLFVAALAACSSPPVPTDTFYNLMAGASPSSGSSIDGTLEVPRFRAEGVVNERAIVYRASATEQRQYNYHYWAEPPAVMIQRRFIDSLRAAGVFDRVASPEVRADRDYELIGTIRKFEHVAGGGPSKVVVELEVALRRVRGGETVLLKTYTAERPTGMSVPGAVEAMSTSLNQVISEVVRDIAATS